MKAALAPSTLPFIAAILFCLLISSVKGYSNPQKRGNRFTTDVTPKQGSALGSAMVKKDGLLLREDDIALYNTPLAVGGSIRKATDEEIETNIFYAKILASYYCMNVFVHGEYVCGNCDPRLKIIKQYISPIYDVHLMILRSDSLGGIYIALGGAISPQNGIFGFEIIQVDYPLVKGAKVHKGFLDDYNSIRYVLLEVLEEQVTMFPSYQIGITGNSFGGPHALLCALDLFNLGGHYTLDNLKLHTQGQPRVGDDVFAKYVVSTNIYYQRVVNERDIIPHIPPQVSPAGTYMHAGEEHWTKDGVTYICSNGLETKNCSNTVLMLNPEDHFEYLGIKMTVPCN